MKNFILTAFLMFFLVPASWACEGDDHAEYTEPLIITSKDTGAEYKFNVETVATPEAMEQGLMFRSSMPEDHGMLFLFGEERARNFWMKNTLLPLDIIFIKGDGTIRHIHKNAVPMDETPLPSQGPVLTVLEINGGLAEKLGIKAGDTISLASPDEAPDKALDITSPIEE